MTVIIDTFEVVTDKQDEKSGPATPDANRSSGSSSPVRPHVLESITQHCSSRNARVQAH